LKKEKIRKRKELDSKNEHWKERKNSMEKNVQKSEKELQETRMTKRTNEKRRRRLLMMDRREVSTLSFSLCFFLSLSFPTGNFSVGSCHWSSTH